MHQYFEYGGLELYNLKDDPSEMNILASSNPKKFQELLQKLVKWRTDHGAPIPTTKVPDYHPTFEKEAIDKALK